MKDVALQNLLMVCGQELRQVLVTVHGILKPRALVPIDLLSKQSSAKNVKETLFSPYVAKNIVDPLPTGLAPYELFVLVCEVSLLCILFYGVMC